MADPKGLLIAAPQSGSGKTLFTLGLLAALKAKGVSVAPAKTGPDYIDPQFHARAASGPCINLDPWAMGELALKSRAAQHAVGSELLVVEGVMGLFDGAANGKGSTADLAAVLDLPEIFVVDAARQSQSIAALVSGFANWRADVSIGGIVLNNVGSARHESLLRKALEPLAFPVVGCLPRVEDLQVPSRHLGLVQPDEMAGIDQLIARAADLVASHCDLDLVARLACPLHPSGPHTPFPPLGQNIAIARDQAFGFSYPHMLEDWHRAGASISFFSPLADESPATGADAVFLPGGYPELHGARLSAATNFFDGLRKAAERSALIYGECGGYMVLGKGLTDRGGKRHAMAGLLPLESRIDQPKRVLGYRHLRHSSPLPFAEKLAGHEFHYSTGSAKGLPPLFYARDALGESLPPMGAIKGRVMGSYAHIIDSGEQNQ